ncbi:hypothetical protein B0I35DRAFT_481474 [Stachybotrys elegans]|uniref:F-box domain-containing protein n=1 Tax=Stachybotrys elegans TaxID=80388 RepID=A0A8K0SPK4_9HYPO|nr:hypothetical protein B0I35DRAFT_481474 [Stachybotrys elegans]
MEKIKQRFSRRLSRNRRPNPAQAPTVAPIIAPEAAPEAATQAATQADMEPEAPVPLSQFTHTCTLEQVPFEIRHHILLAFDSPEDLCALVRASPVYRRQYRPKREYWLWRCMWALLDRTLIDAWDVYKSNGLVFRQSRTLKRQFIAEFETRRSITDDELSDTPRHKYVMRITHFYMSYIRPLVQEYVAWAHGNLPALSTPLSLSKTEERRIIRRMYRFQLFCNYYGALPYASQKEASSPEERYAVLLFKTLNPWENEEFLCIDEFVESKYLAIFNQVRADLHPDSPRFDPVRTDMYTPPGAYSIDEYRECHLKYGTASLGLKPLSTVLQIAAHSKLVDFVAENIASAGTWMEEFISESAQEWRRQNAYSDHDRAQDTRQELLFTGDQVDLPPKGWVAIWGGTYSNLYGHYIPPSLRT